MSRPVDMENQDSWTDDDIIYLRDRGKLPQGYDLPSDLRSTDPSEPPLDETPYIGDVGTILDAPLSGPSNDSTGTFVDDEDFGEMSKSRLQAEARARNIDDSGTKAELADRLTAYELGQG